MKDGFIKAAAGFNDITVADVGKNIAGIKQRIDEADSINVNILVLPELCITGYTCSDLFASSALIEGASRALCELAEYTSGKFPVVLVGLPMVYRGKLYNCAAVMFNGSILGIVPKTLIPNYGEFYERRHFSSGADIPAGSFYCLNGTQIPFGTDLVFRHSSLAGYTFACEICEDAWGPTQKSEVLCRAGALIIANLSASNEVIGKANYRRTLISSTSARLLCGYIYSDASSGESTQDMVFSGHCIVAENGVILAENKPFGENRLTVSEIDVKKLCGERQKNTSFCPTEKPLREIVFNQEIKETALTRTFSKNPFVPDNESAISGRAEAILQMQSHGLKKRLEHTGAQRVVIGVSGGLDSTLALLVAVRTMKLMNRPLSDIYAVTMPCFGTTSRTRCNSELLCRNLGVTFREVDITKAVRQHFEDIGQCENVYDATYENSQARERTQVLMDIANKTNGIVLGTGDLSELALGWATYNGDHMSMYGVNASVPKTLVRYIVGYEAMRSPEEMKKVLLDILDTPVSPELLPADDKGEISQKTEDLVGPYELHDFFLYHFLRYGETPEKILRLALYAFEGEYTRDVISKWLRVFLKRFFSQQFKRSCLPDGVKVGTVSLSPRGDWRMPSDASAALWLNGDF